MRLLQTPLFLILFSALLAGLTWLGMQPPQAVPETAPKTQFSAVRALNLLRELNPDNLPHPAGSQQNHLQRDRILGQLGQLGLSAEVQSLEHCKAAFGVCSPLDNIIARLPGSGEKPALMLTAHYDSVDAGMGAGDDGSGLSALLEIADMAVRKGGFRHDLVFLITDAEEQGLVGADAFALEHPAFADVGVVINLEARGVTGASSMFESGAGNRSWIRMLAQSLERPVANSISREVYRRMPNDTDFSVYRDLGRSGFNFAFAGGGAVYHSAIDDLQQLDINSLQHHGQNAWALLQVMDQRDLQRVSTEEDAAYIDLFGLKLVHYPASSATGLALVFAVIVLVLIRMGFRRQLSLRQSAWCLLFIVLLLPLLVGLGWLLSWPLGHWPDLNRMGHPYPWLGRGALLLTAALALRLMINSLSQRATTGAVSLVCWLLYAAAAMLASVKLPTASFVYILPLAGFVLGALVDGMFWKRRTQLLFARLFGFAAATYLAFYFLFTLEVVLSFEQAHFQVIPLYLGLVAALPLLVSNLSKPVSSRWSLVLLLAPLLAACVGQQFLPGHTVERPRGMNLVYRAIEGQEASWWQLETSSSDPDRQYVESQGFSEKTLQVPGRGDFPLMAKSADRLSLPAVSVASSSFQPIGPDQADGKSSVHTAQLLLPEQLRQLVIYLPDNLDFTEVRVNGKVALQKDLASQQKIQRRVVALNRPAAGPMQLQVIVPASPATAGPAAAESLRLPARARFELPEELLQTVLQGWPLDAQPQHFGHRAEVHFELVVE
jgi:hypothetical protein